MPDAPSFPPQSESITSTGGSSGPTSPISLEPASTLPDSLQERQMNIPQSDKLFGALAGEGTVSSVLQGVQGPVTIRSGQQVDPVVFKALVLSTAIPGKGL
jgi:hypothetical protein